MLPRFSGTYRKRENLEWSIARKAFVHHKGQPSSNISRCYASTERFHGYVFNAAILVLSVLSVFFFFWFLISSELIRNLVTSLSWDDLILLWSCLLVFTGFQLPIVGRVGSFVLIRLMTLFCYKAACLIMFRCKKMNFLVCFFIAIKEGLSLPSKHALWMTASLVSTVFVHVLVGKRRTFWKSEEFFMEGLMKGSDGNFEAGCVDVDTERCMGTLSLRL